MSYTPPNADAVQLDFNGAYSPPTAMAVFLNFGEIEPPQTRLLLLDVRGDWQDGTWHTAAPLERWSAMANCSGLNALNWLGVELIAADGFICCGHGDLLGTQTAGKWLLGQARAMQVPSSWLPMQSHFAQPAVQWGNGQWLMSQTLVNWSGRLQQIAQTAVPWGKPHRLAPQYQTVWRYGQQLQAIHDVVWRDARLKLNSYYSILEVIQPDDPPYVPPFAGAVVLDLQCHYPPRLGGLVGLNFGDAVCIPRLRIQGSLAVRHDISIVKLPEREPIGCMGLRLNNDIGSFCWSGSAIINPAFKSLVSPAANGDMAELEISIDGKAWRLFVERVKRSGKFAESAMELSLKGGQLLLAAPYAPKQSRVIDQPITAQQLANDLLPFGSDYSVSWGVTDWTIPAHTAGISQQTTIEAIGKIAKATGAVVVADPLGRALHVVYRYPVSPWAWNAAAVVATLDASAIETFDESMEARPEATMALVAGQADGVIAEVRRADRTTDIWAESVVDPLVTDPQVGRQRGRNELSAAGRWWLSSVSAMYAPVLTEVASLLQIGNGADAYRAQITSVDITVNVAANEVDLNLGLERVYG